MKGFIEQEPSLTSDKNAQKIVIVKRHCFRLTDDLCDLVYTDLAARFGRCQMIILELLLHQYKTCCCIRSLIYSDYSAEIDLCLFLQVKLNVFTSLKAHLSFVWGRMHFMCCKM